MNEKNGLMLASNLEQALDLGRIVIVPSMPEADEEVRWTCFVTEVPDLSNHILRGLRWRDIDGRELTFRGPNRPAKRYLYFRFLMTYLQWQRLGNVKWMSKIDTKGKVWASPGKYLRHSTLLTFAELLGDRRLPEEVYDQTTFLEADGSPARSKDEEKVIAMSMLHQLNDRSEAQLAAEKSAADEDFEDEDDNEDD